METWNSANEVVFYGKSGGLTGSDRENQEVFVLALHLLQQILAEPEWSERMTDEDRSALSPLFWRHFNPYGRFVLDMGTRLDLAATEPPGRSLQPDRDAVPGGPI